MPYYPILIDLRGQKAVVVGGGQVAQRKIETLLEYEAEVHVIARELTPSLRAHVEADTIRWIGKEYDENHLTGASLVIAATDDPVLNHRVSVFARATGILINVVDQPSECSFIVPSILRRGDLSIAVSTSGNSPMLAKKIRMSLEKQFGEEYELLLNLLGSLRKEIQRQGFAQAENRRIFQALVESPILDALAQNRWNDVASIVDEITRVKWSAEEISKMVLEGGHNRTSRSP